MNSNKRAYTRRLPIKPKPLPLYLLPPSNMARQYAAFLPRCPICGTGHDIGIRERAVGDVWDVGVSCEGGYGEFDVKFTGRPIPPKHRNSYVGSNSAYWSDAAVTPPEHKRARALCKKAIRLERSLARAERASEKRKTHSESYGPSVTH